MSDQPTAVEAMPESQSEDRLRRLAWWIGFVAAPVVGVIAMLVIAFVILRLPFPFSR